MKNILLGILLLASVEQAQAQQRFFKLIEGWKNEKIVETDSSYLSIGLSTTPSYHNYYRFNEIDKQGNLMSSKSFDIDTFSELNIYASNDILPCDNKWLIMGAGYLPTNTKGTALIFNSELSDTLLGRKLFYETATILRCPIAISNGYVCLAECYKANGDMYMKWLMLDSNLVVTSSNDYNPIYTSTRNWLTPNQLQQTIDGGYLISCMEQTFSNNGDSKRLVLIKTNSQGVQQWRRYVGDANYLCEGGYAVAAPDGGWLVAWGAPMTYAMVSQSNMQDGVRIEKIRANGSTEWVTNLGNYFEQVSRRATYYPKQFQALADGNYLVSGKTQGHGFLVKVDSNGNPLWYRLILDPLAAQNNVFYAGAMIYSTTPTSDGGFICAGEYQSDPGGLFPNLVQSAFAMKLDEYGCLEPGCQLLDAVEEVEANTAATITVSPNPSTGLYYINQSSDAPLLVYDINGQLLQHYAPHTAQIDLSQLTAGLYILSIGTDKQRLIKL